MESLYAPQLGLGGVPGRKACYTIWENEVEFPETSQQAKFRQNCTSCISVLMTCRPLQVWGCLWGIVVSTLASINEVNLRRARLVLRQSTMSGFNSRCRTFISVCNQLATQGQLSLPSLRVSKWVPEEGKGRYMVHSVSRWTRGVQVKLWNPLRTRAILERLWGVFTTRHYTNPRLPLPSTLATWRPAGAIIPFLFPPPSFSFSVWTQNTNLPVEE